MDPQSLDAAVQNTLSGLFPPFEATAPTVLSQLFRVLEARYHGDGLCCLLDFLIPLKRLLEHVRQAACAPYAGCVFLHEGWPLCLREKVVVHLSPLNPLLLRPGDFYLQAEPCGEQSACLVVKCLSRDLTTAEKIPIPDASCSWLFTKEWLEEINRDLERPTLRTCLVATGNGIVPVLWNKVATPEFVQMPRADDAAEKDSNGPEANSALNSQQPSSPLSREVHASLVESPGPPQGKYPGLIKVDQCSWKKSSLFVVPSLCDIISENLEGEYVNLVGFSEEGKKWEMSSPSETTPVVTHQQLQQEASERVPLWTHGENEVTAENWSCGKGQDLEEGPCTPCLRRRLSQDPKVHEPRCRYRDSYMAALQNPISFSSGLMAAILEEMDFAQTASPSDSTEAQQVERPRQEAPAGLPEPPNEEGKTEEVSKPLKLLKSPAEGPVAGSRFSFRKGPRPSVSLGDGTAAPERTGKGQDGPRRKALTVSSPKTARAGPAAVKGAAQPNAAGLGAPPPLSVDGAALSQATADPPRGDRDAPGSSPPEPAQWGSLRPELLSSGIACLPGNVDKLGRPIVEISPGGRGWQAPWCSAQDVAQLLLCLCTAARKRSKDQQLMILIDARKEPLPPTLSTALGSIQKLLPGSIQVVLLVVEKEAASHMERLPGLQVEAVSSLKALGRHVDSSQLTEAFEGQFPYNHAEWAQFFQKIHHFVSGLRKASELLRSTTQELEKGAVPETLQAVEQQMARHRQLMEEVLCDAQLVSLQREGGAMLARLRKEAAWLSSSPDVRSSFEGTLSLYNRVEEEVHLLVTKSNSCLEQLQFLRKIRKLEEEFSQVNVWIDEVGEPALSVVGSSESSMEGTEKSYCRFREFFKEATVYYNHGLSLAKEAAKVQGPRFLGMGAFEAAKGAFQAKLTVFYMAMERKGAELETFLDLYRFCDKVTAFNLDCKRHLAMWKAGEKDRDISAFRQGTEDALQRLSEDFSAEKFQQMKIQASSMPSEKGQLIWKEALERCHEAKQVLEDMLLRCKEAKAGSAGEGREESHPLNPNPVPKILADAGKASGRTKNLEASSRGSVDRTDDADPPFREDSSRSSPAMLGKGVKKGSLAPPDDILEPLEADIQGPCEEASERLHTTSPDSLPPPSSSSKAKQRPDACETLPWAPVRGRAQRSREKEQAQYFQLSRHGSFSSEDADSQNSEDTSSTLSMEMQGLKAGGAQEKGLGILYLENHSPSGSAVRAATP